MKKQKNERKMESNSNINGLENGVRRHEATQICQETVN